MGDVYLIRLSFQNLGNCTTDLGETSYRFDPQLKMPKRHVPIHGFEYGGQSYRIQCVMRDPAGAQTEIAGDTCAKQLGKDPTGRWFIDTMGGTHRSRYVVPRGNTLEVTVPVIAIDPIAKNEAGVTVHVEVLMDALQSGFDFFDVAPPMTVASRPLMVGDPKAQNVTATSAALSANFYSRFNAGEIYIQLDPAPLFDSIRTTPATEDIHHQTRTAVWANLTPDTDYTWRAGLLIGDMRIVTEEQRFRTAPATAANVVPGRASVGPGDAGPASAVGWALLLAAMVMGLVRRRQAVGLLAVAALLLAGCASEVNDTPADPGVPATGGRGGAAGAGATGGSATMGGTGGGSGPAGGGAVGNPLPLTFLRAHPGLFTVPKGWEVNDASLKAWQQNWHHVVTMSPPGKPDVVLGVREFNTHSPPDRVIYLASLQAEVVEVLENKKGSGEGMYARWVARVTLEGKPAIMAMYAWGTPGISKGDGSVMLAALLTPTLAELEALGGIDTLRRLSYGQYTYDPKEPELELSGEYVGAESTGGFYDPVTGQTSSSGHGLSLSLSGDKISVVHSIQVSNGVGASYNSVAATVADGTFIRAGGMIVPSWTSCSTETRVNGSAGGRGACPKGWGATINLIPRDNGSFMARMPGMEIVGAVDEPGTVDMRKR